MRALAWAMVLALLSATAATAAERPDWAFGPETPPPRQPPPADPDQVMRLPGSTQTYTLRQLEDQNNPPDWFPDENIADAGDRHAGHGPTVRACITCHVGNGHGHPENSRLPGATATYLLRQLVDMRSGARGKAPVSMINIAKALTEEELRESNRIFP